MGSPVALLCLLHFHNQHFGKQSQARHSFGFLCCHLGNSSCHAHFQRWAGWCAEPSTSAALQSSSPPWKHAKTHSLLAHTTVSNHTDQGGREKKKEEATCNCYRARINRAKKHGTGWRVQEYWAVFWLGRLISEAVCGQKGETSSFWSVCGNKCCRDPWIDGSGAAQERRFALGQTDF